MMSPDLWVGSSSAEGYKHADARYALLGDVRRCRSEESQRPAQQEESNRLADEQRPTVDAARSLNLG